MSARSRIVSQQKAWAQGAGLTVVGPGYLGSVDANLRLPMSPRTLAAFQAEEAAELKDYPRFPAKLRALFSSAALVVNVFGNTWAELRRRPSYWPPPLGIEGNGATHRLRGALSDQSRGHPAQCGSGQYCAFADGRNIGIESKFT